MKEFKWFRFTLIILFVIFITLYISQATGYYDYQQQKKVSLTADKIKQFEKDIEAGKNIKLEDYMENTRHSYNNGFSQLGLNLSKTVEHYIKAGIDSTFKFFEKLLIDEG